MFDFLFGDSKKIKVLERTLEEKDKTIKALQTELSYHKLERNRQNSLITNHKLERKMKL
ncbi:hypothetical protein [Sulfurimonas sp.]|uniref:hypothetical protein n=1 Tax=Sulfurimonas sp. TaxID=2022749 RepID=UPI003D0F480B